MNTYLTLLAQRAELDKKIETERAAARAAALATVRELCAGHGIAGADLAPSASKGKPRAVGSVPAKYRKPVIPGPGAARSQCGFVVRTARPI